MKKLTGAQVAALTSCPECKARKGSPCKGAQFKNFCHRPRFDKALKITRKKENKKEDFLSSWEWTALRYSFLKKVKNRCQCCGWKPGDTADNFLCVDHIKPRSKYPELALVEGNLQVLCNLCNKGKSDLDETRFKRLKR